MFLKQLVNVDEHVSGAWILYCDADKWIP